MTLTGIGDIDLLIIDKLNDGDIENVEKCIRIKDVCSFWKSRLEKKYKVKIEYDNYTSWKRIYLEYARFFEYFHLTMFVALLKDYYSNNFSVYFICYLRKKVKYEGLFPLLETILNLLETPDILTLEKYLLDNKESLVEIQKQYTSIYYNFPHKIKFGKNNYNFYSKREDTLFSLVYSRIFKHDNIFSYKSSIDSEGIFNIKFECDGNF